jgi:Na+/H+ antiporter NhaA
LSDIKWHIMIDAIAAIVIIISLFLTDYLLVTRVVLLLFATADLIMMVNRKKIRKSVFFVISAIFLTGLIISGILEKFTLYMMVFGMVLVIASYRSLFETDEEINKSKEKSRASS